VIVEIENPGGLCQRVGEAEVVSRIAGGSSNPWGLVWNGVIVEIGNPGGLCQRVGEAIVVR
jgi:hypothetical protein